MAHKASKPVVIHGMPWPPNTTQAMVETFSTLKVRKNDVFIVAYPKAGQTWIQEIVWQIIQNGNIDYRRLDVRMPWLEAMILPYPENPYVALKPEAIRSLFESFPSPRVFKSHLPYHLVPRSHDPSAQPRYIYVLRNPKDTAVSFYHHYGTMPMHGMKITLSWNQFFDVFIKGKVIFGSWFDSVRSWWEHRNDPNILFLKYEDTKKNPRATIQTISHFVGKELSSETLDRIVHQTSFSALKIAKHVNYSWARGIKGDFIRKGEVGDWRNYFTEEQSKLFDKLYEDKMAGTGLKFDYDEKLISKL